jgi:hypothetical protein
MAQQDLFIVNFAAGSALSSWGTIPQGYRIAAVENPGPWTTADIAFVATSDPTTYPSGHTVQDAAGNLISVKTTSGRVTLVSPQQVPSGMQYVRLRSQLAGTDVNQANATSLRVWIVPASAL